MTYGMTHTSKCVITEYDINSTEDTNQLIDSNDELIVCHNTHSSDDSMEWIEETSDPFPTGVLNPMS